MRQIPPAFPLEATVAVNPWLGQAGEDRTVAAARMARVGGGRMFLPRETVAAMIEAGEVTPEDVADAAAARGIDPDALVARRQGRSDAGPHAASDDRGPCAAGRRRRLAGPRRGADRPLGGGAFRPGAGVLARAQRPGPGPRGAPMPAAT